MQKEAFSNVINIPNNKQKTPLTMAYFSSQDIKTNKL